MIRLFGHYVSGLYLLLGVLEAMMFFGALYVGVLFRFDFNIPEVSDYTGDVFTTALSYSASMTAAMIAMGLYQRGIQGGEAGFLVRLGISFLLGTTLMSLVFYAFPITFFGRGVFVYSLVFSLMGVMAIRSLFVRFVGSDYQKRRVLALGTGSKAKLIQELLENEPETGISLVGYVRLHDSENVIDEAQQIQYRESLFQLAMAKQVDEIVVAVDDQRKRLPVDEILDCKMSGIQVLDLLTFFEKETSRIKISLLHPSWIFFSTGFHAGIAQQYGKRLLDICASLFILLMAFPVMLIIAAASLIESWGRDPVFYHQERVGLNGKVFKVHKFRSMRVDAESDGVARWASENDNRITRVGAFMRKTRLDELPQVFNVLVGNMSLVGPRPERPEFVTELSKAIPYYAERHRVKPGVTGWAQLLYPYGSTTDDAREKLQFDLYYVKNASLFLDLIILLETVEVVLLGKGAR
jgi:sugar transferase (PEP-CTERM system associated)